MLASRGSTATTEACEQTTQSATRFSATGATEYAAENVGKTAATGSWLLCTALLSEAAFCQSFKQASKATATLRGL